MSTALCERIGCNEPGTIPIHAPLTQNDSVACDQHIEQMLAIGWDLVDDPREGFPVVSEWAEFRGRTEPATAAPGASLPVRVYDDGCHHWWAQVEGTMAGAGSWISRERAIRKALALHAKLMRRRRERDEVEAASEVEWR